MEKEAIEISSIKQFQFYPEQIPAIIIIFVMIIYLVAHYFCNVSKPKIHTSNSSLRGFLDKFVPSLKSDYWPPWFAWGGRIQSGLGVNIRMHPNHKLPYNRHILQLKDGGQLGLDFLGEENLHKNTHNSQAGDKRLVTIILPGLTSCSNESYVKTLALKIVSSGAIAAVVNHRGLGDVPLKTPRTYCATNSEDIQEVIEYIRGKYPGVNIFAVGTSLGGMMLGRYLANYPDQAKSFLVGALVISICWDTSTGNANLEKPFINKYLVNYVLAYNLKRTVRKNKAVLESSGFWDLKQVMTATTIREFDAFFTAPQFGYSSCEEYYKAAQISDDICKFSVPVFALNAMDDPMQPGEYLPIKQACAENSSLALMVTKRGGHLGFLEAKLPTFKPFHFLERVVGEILLAVREHPEELPSIHN